MTRTRTEAPPATSSGIEANGIYSLRDFQARLRLGRHWVRSARKSGLVVRSFGNRSFVSGADFIAFLDSVEGMGADA